MKKTSKGFTLVELIIYMGLLGIFLMVLLDIFTTTLSSKLTTESASALNMDTRYILAKLNYEITNANSITLPASGSAGTTLRLVSGGQTKTISSSSGTLVLTEGGSAMTLNGADTTLTDLYFQNVTAPGGKSTIKFRFTLDSNINVNTSVASQTINSTTGIRQ